MNPMSLLTLPAADLRLAQEHAHRDSPSGERSERGVVSLALTAVALIATVAYWLN